MPPPPEAREGLLPPVPPPAPKPQAFHPPAKAPVHKPGPAAYTQPEKPPLPGPKSLREALAQVTVARSNAGAPTTKTPPHATDLKATLQKMAPAAAKEEPKKKDSSTEIPPDVLRDMLAVEEPRNNEQ